MTLQNLTVAHPRAHLWHRQEAFLRLASLLLSCLIPPRKESWLTPMGCGPHLFCMCNCAMSACVAGAR